MGYIYARLIDKGAKSIDDVPEKWKKATKDAFYDLFGIEL